MTPLYDAIRAFSAQGPVRLHIPGHKGKPLPIPELTGAAALDVTELGPTGDLFHGGEPFDSAQRLWAEDFSMDCCQFLTGGSTLGLHTALALCCRPGDRVLIDRGCHRAVYNALALLDLEPVYLPRPWWEEERLTSTISPESVEKALTEHPEIKTVCITSPSYCGLLCDVKEISHMVHRNGGRLIVDGAHGAHLPFLGVDAFAGADVVVCSAHKTLPALGQSSLLFANGFEPEQVRRMTSVYGSSSPSYPMMISMDGARDWMEGEGKLLYRRTAERTAALRERFPSLQEGALDPTRLTLNAVDGPALARALEARGLWPEMEDGGHVVLISRGWTVGRIWTGWSADWRRFRSCLAAARPSRRPPCRSGSCPPGRPCLPGRSASLWRAAPGEYPPYSWPPIPPGCQWWRPVSASRKKNWPICGK